MKPRDAEATPAMLRVRLDLQKGIGVMGNMRLQPKPFHMLQEFGHRKKHHGVNPARGKEAHPLQEHRPNYCPGELSPHLQASLQLNSKGLCSFRKVKYQD